MKFLLILLTLISVSMSGTFYCVQLASGQDFENVKGQLKRVSTFPDVRIEKIGDFYVLRAGFYTDKENAQRLLRRAKGIFENAFVRRCDFKPERILIPSYQKVRKKFYSYELGMMLARKYIRRKEFEKAEEVYRTLLDRYPDSREIKVQLARVLYWQKRYDEALEIYRQVVDFRPGLVDEMRKVEIARELEEIERLEKEGKEEEAIKRLERLFYEELEQSYDVGMKLGLLYLKKGMRIEAHRVFGILREKYPESGEIKKLYVRTLPPKKVVKKKT